MASYLYMFYFRHGLFQAGSHKKFRPPVKMGENDKESEDSDSCFLGNWFNPV